MLTENNLFRSTQQHKKTGLRDKKYNNTKIQKHQNIEIKK